MEKPDYADTMEVLRPWQVKVGDKVRCGGFAGGLVCEVKATPPDLVVLGVRGVGRYYVKSLSSYEFINYGFYFSKRMLN